MLKMDSYKTNQKVSLKTFSSSSGIEYEHCVLDCSQMPNSGNLKPDDPGNSERESSPDADTRGKSINLNMVRFEILPNERWECLDYYFKFSLYNVSKFKLTDLFFSTVSPKWVLPVAKIVNITSRIKIVKIGSGKKEFSKKNTKSKCLHLVTLFNLRKFANTKIFQKPKISNLHNQH